MGLLDLPLTVIDDIIAIINLDAATTIIQLPYGSMHQCTRMEDMQNLRLVCKQLSSIATRKLFAQAVLAPKESIITSWNALRTHEEYKYNVREVVIDTLVSPEGWSEREPYVENKPKDWEMQMKEMVEFPNVTSVCVVFPKGCENEENSEWNHKWDEDLAEHQHQREKVLQHLFKAIAAVNQTESRQITRLTIVHMQNMISEALVAMPEFQIVLKNLEELHVSVCTEQVTACFEESIWLPEVRSFWPEFTSEWLTPVSPHLKALSLYCDTYFGVIPKWDNSDLYFPNLKSLALGNFCMSYEWQLDWILKHKSLRQISFDDARIGHFYRLSIYNGPREHDIDWDLLNVVKLRDYRIEDSGDKGNKEEEEEHEIDEDSEDSEDDDYENDYATSDMQWDNVFDRIRTELPNLSKFTFGRGAWDEGREFEQRALIANQLLNCRYTSYNDGIGPSQWVDAKKDNYGNERKFCYRGSFDVEYNIVPPCNDPSIREAERIAYNKLISQLMVELD